MKRTAVADEIFNRKETVRTDRINKDDNNGFTLVELIAAMAIFAIVITITLSFLYSGSKGYTNARDEADLQMDSQITLNQLEDLAIEAYWAQFVDVASNVKALLLYKSDYVDIVFWDKDSKKLYLVDEREITDIDMLPLITYTDEQNRMSENITDFNMPTNSSDLKKDNKIQIAISFEAGKKVYPAILNIHLRNKVKEPQS